MGDFNIKATLGLNASEFESGIGRAQSTLGKFTSAMRGLAGGFAVAQMVNFIKKTSDLAEGILNTADALHVGTDFLQDWNHTANIAGVGADKATLALEKLSVKIGEGGAAFRKYGIDIGDAEGNLRSTEDILRDVAEKINSAKTGAEKAALAVEFFGKQGAKLLPLIQQMENLEKASKFSKDELVALAKAGDDWERFAKGFLFWGAKIQNFLLSDMPAAIATAFVGGKTGGTGPSNRQKELAEYYAAKRKKSGSNSTLIMNDDGSFSVSADERASQSGTMASPEEILAFEKESLAIAAKEDAFRESKLRDEAALQELYEKQGELLRERFKFRSGSFEFQQKEIEIEKNRLKIKERELTLEEKIAAEKQKQIESDNDRDVSAIGGYQGHLLESTGLTLGELANQRTSRWNTGAQNQAIRDARRAEFLKGQLDDPNFRFRNPVEALKAQGEVDRIRQALVTAGILKPSEGEKTLKAVQDTAENTDLLLDAIMLGTGTIKVLGAP